MTALGSRNSEIYSICVSIDLSIYLAKFGMEPGIPGVEGPHGGAPMGRLPLFFEVEILENLV